MVSKAFATGLVSLLLLGATSIPAMAQFDNNGRGEEMRFSNNKDFRTHDNRDDDRSENSETRTPLTVEQLACVATAVDKREVAIQTALDTSYNTTKTALSTRRTALAAAWKLSDRTERREAIKTAWHAFKGTWKTAEKQLRADRKAAWKLFRTAARACNVHVEGDEPNSDL